MDELIRNLARGGWLRKAGYGTLRCALCGEKSRSGGSLGNTLANTARFRPRSDRILATARDVGGMHTQNPAHLVDGPQMSCVPVLPDWEKAISAGWRLRLFR